MLRVKGVPKDEPNIERLNEFLWKTSVSEAEMVPPLKEVEVLKENLFFFPLNVPVLNVGIVETK